MDINDFNWISKPIIGTVILIKGGSIDSFRNYIKPTLFYNVGRHKVSGKVTLIPVGIDLESELVKTFDHE